MNRKTFLKICTLLPLLPLASCCLVKQSKEPQFQPGQWKNISSLDYEIIHESCDPQISKDMWKKLGIKNVVVKMV